MILDVTCIVLLFCVVMDQVRSRDCNRPNVRLLMVQVYLSRGPPPNSTSKPFSHCYIFYRLETTRDVLFHDWYQKPIRSSEAEINID